MFISSRIDTLVENKKRANKGITIQDMANEMKMSLSTFNKIKSGQVKPGIDSLEVIARYFGVDMNHFFDIEPMAKEEKTGNVRVIDGNEYMTRRFEELIIENTKLKQKVEAYEKVQEKSYALQNVPDLNAAEPATKLKK